MKAAGISRAKNPVDTTEAEPDAAGLFEQLRSLRLEISKELGVPPYVVFHDKTLREMAALKPSTRAELLRVSGVGERKAERYGARFLEHIRAAAS